MIFLVVAAIIVAVWAMGFFVVAARALYGYCTLWSLGRWGSVPFEIDEPQPEALATRMRVPGPWQLRQCATREMAVPVTWGWIRSVVMLPTDADQWPKSRLEAVILHELAHVRRRDFRSQAMMELACAVFWFLPPMWTAAEDLRVQAELEADQAVLRAGMRPSEYAGELLTIARELGNRRLPAIYGGTPAVKNAKIEARLHAILSSDLGRRSSQ
jgi:beta-lactamase regulating signal transducer with metallopeptidase domain